jgi:predicted enzyme related to lactoylglutathione lyase
LPAQLPPHWVPYFSVPDVDAATQKARELGGQALTEPMAVPSGRFVPLAGPLGATFAVFEGRYDAPPGA